MDHWRTSRRAASAPTPPGGCARRSPTTCCAPPACSPQTRTPAPADRRYDAGSSTSRPDWPAPNTDRSCTYPPTGPGRRPGLRCGTTPSDTAHRYPHQPDPPAERPDQTPTGKLGKPADTSCTHTAKSRSPDLNTTQPGPSVDRGLERRVQARWVGLLVGFVLIFLVF